MTRLHTYALMASKVYSVPDASKTMIQGWTCTARYQGEEGLKSAVYAKGDEVVVAFKGTSPFSETGRDDLAADIKLAVGVIPNQVWEAEQYFKIVKDKLGGHYAHFTLTGHSLGGGLAQMVGYFQNTRFVTFNAPPMGSCLSNIFHGGTTREAILQDVSGFNYRLKGDIVSSSNTSRTGHIGEVITLPRPNLSKNLFNFKNDVHKMRTVRYQLMRLAEGKQDPFA